MNSLMMPLALLYLLAAVTSNAFAPPGPVDYSPTSPRSKLLPRSVTELKIKIDGKRATWNITWERVAQYMSVEEVKQIWKESGLNDDLKTTFDLYSQLYKVDKEAKNAEPYKELGFCEEYKGKTLVNFKKGIFTSTINQRYDGNFGIYGNQLSEQLFFYLSDLFKPEQEKHKLFYSQRTNMVYSTLSFLHGNYELTGVVTKHFMFVVVTATETSGKQHSLTAVFGKNSHLPSLKGYMVHEDITVVKNDKESLMLVTSFEDYAHFNNYLLPNWSDIFSTITNSSVTDLAISVQNTILSYSKLNYCDDIKLDAMFFSNYFYLISLHYKVGAELDVLGNKPVPFNCMLDKLYEISTCFDMFRSCYRNFHTRGFVSSGVTRASAAVIGSLPIFPQTDLSISKEAFLKTLYFAENYAPIEEKSLHGITLTLLDVYNRYINDFNLSRDDTRTLFYVFNSLKNKQFSNSTSVNKYLMLAYCITTSMCSASEIARSIDFWGSSSSYNVYTGFSPCFMSLRYDYTIEKLNIEGMQDINLSKNQLNSGIATLYTLLQNRFNKRAMDMLVIRPCITDPSKVKLIVPFEQCTFVISHGIAALGKTYDVSETFLRSSMVITVVANERCIFDSAPKTTLKIPVLYNMTRPKKKCHLCQSVVLSYDEYDGIESMVYVSSHKVQQQIFSDKSSFFDSQNMHTHYLLLMNNGTVFEIKGFYKDRAINMLIFIMFFIAACAAAFILYKLVLKMLF